MLGQRRRITVYRGRASEDQPCDLGIARRFPDCFGCVQFSSPKQISRPGQADAQWIADDVTVNEDKIYNFIWDNEDHKARMITHRVNNSVKFEYLPETEEDEDDPSSIELKLEVNELTQTVFIHIIEYTDFDDEEEWVDLWDSMVNSLKEIVGG